MNKIDKELEALEALNNVRKLFVGSPIDLSQQLGIIESVIKKAYRMNFINNMLCEVVLDNKENVSQKQLIYLCTEMRKIMNEE